MPKISRGVRSLVATKPRACQFTETLVRFSFHDDARFKLYYQGTNGNRKRFAKAFDAAIKGIVGRTQINQQNLILIMMNDAGKISPKLG